MGRTYGVVVIVYIYAWVCIVMRFFCNGSVTLLSCFRNVCRVRFSHGDSQ
jgi:hypothetical protein